MQKKQVQDYNPRLQHWDRQIPNQFAGKGLFIKPGETENIIWQTRAYLPSKFEHILINHIQDAYEQDAKTAEDITAYLNEVGIFDEFGNPWTQASFEDYIVKVGY